MKHWIILPDSLVKKIEQECLRNKGKFTINILLQDLNDFAKNDLQKFNVALWKFYKERNEIASKETLKRALNKRPDNGVFFKHNKNLLDFLCYYSCKKSWNKALKIYGISEQNIQIRTCSFTNPDKHVKSEIKKFIDKKGEYVMLLVSNALKEINDWLNEGYIISPISKNENDKVNDFNLTTVKSLDE